MSDDKIMALLVSFPDQSNSFALGFGAGMVWQRMSDREPVIDIGFVEGIPAREENLELISRMCACAGYKIERGDIVEGWCPVRLSISQTTRPKLEIVGGNET